MSTVFCLRVENMSESLLKPGKFVVIQRQGYTKLHKLKEHGTVTLGHFVIELDNVIGHRYFETFQMKLKPGTKKLYTLEKVKEASTVLDINREKSGNDNRNITDDGASQNLSKEEIVKLQEESASSSEIVESLVNNSKTFASKTEYSQEKYLKKKEKKYFEYVQVRKPSIRLLAQMFYRQDPAKTQGLRVDDLSQILTNANIQTEGNYILYDSGTNGLVTAAVLDQIGSQTKSKLIHMHPGNECQKNAFVAMHFPPEQAERCINVNLYSVLRCYYQNKSESVENKTNTNASENETNVNVNETNANENKRNTNASENETNANENKRNTCENESESPPAKKPKLESAAEINTAKKPHWQLENERACELLRNKTDALIVIAKEHPVTIVKELQVFLNPSRSLVAFSLLREPLQDLYVYLKTRCDFVCIKLSNNFMRHYQVLPERTHPEVNMCSGGYILTAHKLAL